MCVGYEIDGVVTKDFPTTQKLEKAKPVYKVLPGWNCDIRGIRNYEDLPEACRNYINYYNNTRIQAKTKWMPPSTFREASMMDS